MRRSLRLAAVTTLLLAAGLIGAAQPESGDAIQAAPAFTAQQLLTPPGSAWLTNGDTLYNQRFSPLTVVHLSNHSHLSGAYAIGTADESLSRPILQFIQTPPR